MIAEVGRGPAPVTARPCPACAAERPRAIGVKNGFDLRACGSCGSIFTATLPGAAGAQDYDGYYHPENLAIPDSVRARLAEIVGGFAPYRRQNRLLDIGFGAAALLQAAAGEGWTADGVEVSRSAVQHALALGLNAFHGELAAANYPAGAFDVVVAVEVLEHVPAPAALLAEARRILRPGGLLWATTPNAAALSARLLGTSWSIVAPPEHLQLLTPRGLRALLRTAGFDQVRIATHGLNPAELLARRSRRPAAKTGCDRVEAGYALNAYLSAGPARRGLKYAANHVLNATRLGDSLKVWATA